jgi:apolipoprotein N-acyltransferase
MTDWMLLVLVSFAGLAALLTLVLPGPHKEKNRALNGFLLGFNLAAAMWILDELMGRN